jgi:hypothetical protein
VSLLLLAYGLALTSMGGKSPTFDEQAYLTRGLAYLRGENRHMLVGHPLGLNALNALLLASDDDVKLPTDHPSWQESDFHRPSELFMWEIGNDVAKVLLLGRLPALWVTLLLLAAGFRWATELAGDRRAGLLALALLSLDPNILAHGRLATTDLGFAAGALLAGSTLWRFLKVPSLASAIVAGVMFGLLQNTKSTAVLFLPLLALVILANISAVTRRIGGRRLLALLGCYAVAAVFTLWAAYGFQAGPLPDSVPPPLQGLNLPLSHHLEQFLHLRNRLQQPTPAFLLGNYSTSGWWYYFPVAFLLKTPLPTLAFLALAGGVTLARVRRPAGTQGGFRRDMSALLIPPLGYFAFTLTSNINLGYRFLLPLLPFFYVFIAYALAPLLRGAYRHYAVPGAVGLLGLLALSNLTIYPHYLAYFNPIAGGPQNGWHYLVDSNIDWGQDLASLPQWMAENGAGHVWLSYFGEGRPEYYGINYTGLDSFPPRLMNPQARPFFPHDPAPGIYAISVTNLQGVHFANHDQFAWFREREPLDHLGHSILLYEVPAYGQPADLALSGVQLDEIRAGDFARLQTNAVTPHWFDASEAWLFPAGRHPWLALGHGGAGRAVWQELLADLYEPVADGPTYSLYRQVVPAPSPPDASQGVFHHAQDSLQLWETVPQAATIDAGETLQIQTTWRQNGRPQPLKLFVHVAGADEAILTQWDGLGAPWEGWRSGGVLQQIHMLTFPADAPAGTYQIWIGVYNPQTGERWQTAGGDRLLAGHVTVRATN